MWTVGSRQNYFQPEIYYIADRPVTKSFSAVLLDCMFAILCLQSAPGEDPISRPPQRGSVRAVSSPLTKAIGLSFLVPFPLVHIILYLYFVNRYFILNTVSSQTEFLRFISEAGFFVKGFISIVCCKDFTYQIHVLEFCMLYYKLIMALFLKIKVFFILFVIVISFLLLNIHKK